MAQSGTDQLPSGDTQGSFSPFLTLLPEEKACKSPNSLSGARATTSSSQLQIPNGILWPCPYVSLQACWNGLVSKRKPYHLCTPFPEWHVVLLCGDHLPSDFCNSVHTRLNKLHPRPAWLKSVTFPKCHSSIPSWYLLAFLPQDSLVETTLHRACPSPDKLQPSSSPLPSP